MQYACLKIEISQIFTVFHLRTYLLSLQALREAHTQFQATLTQYRNELKQLSTLDRQIKTYRVTTNP